MPKNRKLLWFLLLTTAAGGGALAVTQRGQIENAFAGSAHAYEGKAELRIDKEKARTVPVATAKAQRENLRVTLEALGTVTPLQNVTVRPQISGQLMELGFQEGQYVQKGDFLAQIDARPYENALSQAQGALAKDEALLHDAQGTLARYEKLVKQGSVSQQQYDTQNSLVQQLTGTVQEDMAQIATAKLNLDYCHITAPISGRVGLRVVDVGNYVQTSDTSGIVTLAETKPISVLFTVPQDRLGEIQDAMKDGGQPEVVAFDRTRSKKLATGKLVALDNQIDTSTGTVKLRAQFENEDGALFPNQFVNVSLLLKTLEGAVTVPVAAVQRGSIGTYVYVVTPEEKASIKNVTLGPSDGEKAAIEQGVEEGDVVVTDGGDKLSEGTKISLPQGGKEAP